jgi:polyisoprenoid-binding protein YceI
MSGSDDDTVHVSTPGGAALGKWTLDPYHTQVEFSAKHLGMMTVRGHFLDVTATGDINVDEPERSTVEVTLNAASIRTHNEKRDNDLRGAYLLDVDKYPTIMFNSTKVAAAGPDRFLLTGDLTIKGTTRPATLNVIKYGEFTDPNMGHRIGYAAEGKIDRRDFGMTFDMVLDSRLVVSHEIQINIEGELLEVPEIELAGIEAERPATAGRRSLAS